MRASFSMRTAISRIGRGEPAVPRREAEREVAARVLAEAARARDPEAGPPREPLALPGEERRVGREDDDDRARSLGRARERHGLRADPLADRHAVHAQPPPRAVVRLHEGADRPPVRSDARRRADAALEAVADHPGAAADRALGDRPPAAAASAAATCSGPDVEAVDVVEEAVPRLADDRQAPRSLARRRRGDQRVADDADRVRVGERDRARQQAGVAHPLEPGQLAVAVDAGQPAKSGSGWRHHDRDAVRTSSPSTSVVCPTRTSGHVRDRVRRAARKAADLDAELGGARLHRASLENQEDL